MALLARFRHLATCLSPRWCRSLSLNPDILKFSEEVQQALLEGAPVVALESTIITHGMPYPQNLETASEVEKIIREQGATPATIAILKGQVTVGLSTQQLGALARSTNAVKTSRRDMAYVVSNELDGATTVAGTIVVAELAGIPVFATGGLGGVHRGGQHTLDVSADLTELGRSSTCVVCSGVKSILDIPRTLEYLETQGVFVAAYGSSRNFPAFYTRRSGHQAPNKLEDAAQAARALWSAHALRLGSGMLVAVPVPEHSAMNESEIELAIESALLSAEERGVRGKHITPFLLAAVAEATEGRSLATNIALIKNNAKVGAEIAFEFNKLKKRGTNRPPSEKPRHENGASVNGVISRSFHTGSVSFTHSAEEPQERRVREGVLVIGGANLDRTYRLIHDDIKAPSLKQLVEIENRLTKIQEIYPEFDRLQTDIETLSEIPDDQYAEREVFENQYYQLISAAQLLLGHRSSQDGQTLASPARGNGECGITRPGGSIKLPTIELPTFSGQYQHWLEFRDTYTSLIHKNDNIQDIHKFHYLRAALKGSALLIVDSLEFSASNYTIAWEQLCQRFDNNKLLINNHLKALFNIAAIKEESSKAIRYILDTYTKNLRSLETLGEPVNQWDTMIIHVITNKLDSVTAREWEVFRNALPNSPKLSDLTKYLRDRADLLETTSELKPKTNNSSIRSLVVTSHSNKSQLRPKSCPLCKGDHRLYACSDFKNLSIEARNDKIKEFKYCINCLRPGHRKTDCTLGHCKLCTEKHNTMLHTNSPTIALPATFSDRHIVLLSTAIVNIVDGQGKSHPARALLDNGSMSCFISQNLCHALKLATQPTTVSVTGINNSFSNISQKCDLIVKSRVGKYKKHVSCFVIPRITQSIPGAYIDITDIPIPSHVNLADYSFNTPGPIDMLLGAEVFWDILNAEKVKAGTNITLHSTKLGWILAGSTDGTKHNTIQTTQCYSTDTQSKNSDIQSQLSRFWELDHVSQRYSLSQDERDCETIFTTQTKRQPDGRFKVKIPLKDSPERLGESFEQAKRQFHSLERRFERDTQYKQAYIDFMNEYIHLSHMSENTNSFKPNTSDSRSYFCPHHGVKRESSTTTKLRVVFNASAPTSTGISFNNIQMVGPVVQDDLFSILLRFRQHKYVVTADIEKMYRQILIDEEQRTLQQIIWRANKDETLRVYTLNTVTYGTASAPYLATRCINQLSRECDDEQVANAISHDFYVDDYISGADTEHSLKHIVHGVIGKLSSAQFHLRKWRSNNFTLLKMVDGTLSSDDPLDLGAKEQSKTLGINWHSQTDTFSFPVDIDIPVQNSTKRSVLSTIAHVFDPLGFVLPCIVQAKLIMQRLWINKASWDDPLPHDIQLLWSNFAKDLPALRDLQIARRVTCDNPNRIEMHVFSDASETAYGASAYLRSVSGSGSIHVHFLTAKGKVAPVKHTTIPRLELSAALIGTRLASKILDSLRLQIDKTYFWSDSTIVLSWLKTSPNLLKPFVRNRISEIQDTTRVHTWKYVPTKTNPADIASRGMSAHTLKHSTLWWSGPSFLHNHEGSWPSQPIQLSQLHLPEMTQSPSHCLTTQVHESFILKFSNFNKLQRTVAYMLRFIHNCQHKNKLSGILAVSELEAATRFLLRLSQRETFSDEYITLQQGRALSPKNRLITCTPFMDDDGLIRVGGRLKNSPYEYDVKHPVLLQSQHHLTHLIFDYLHRKHLHAGPQLLLATVRQRYWPLGGRNLARKTVRSCIKCSRFKAETVQPIMGNLPEQRTNSEFVFETTGVDYAGPVLIADKKGRGCKLIKAYICIFVCFAVKAVHLELVSDLTTQTYIAALNRFIARRSKPKTMFSDNGTNFVGAANYLSTFLTDHQDEIITYSANEGIQFHFSPARAATFGGLWEAAVRSTKYHLRRVLTLAHLTYEEMYTVLTQIEAILNSRPLTPMSSDPNDLTPLTPSHFLIGRSVTMLPLPQVVGVFASRLQRYERIELLKQHFWKRFSHEYITELQRRHKWSTSRGNLQLGALVVIKEDGLPPLRWLLGRIVQLYPGSDGVTRVVDVKTHSGTYRRAASKLCPLPLD